MFEREYRVKMELDRCRTLKSHHMNENIIRRSSLYIDRRQMFHNFSTRGK